MNTRLRLQVSLFLVVIAGFGGTASAQNVGMNASGAVPHPSAMLDISSTSSGFLMPRMSTAQRDAIASPAIGLQVFNTTSGKVNTYDGISWTESSRKNYVLVQALSDFPAPVAGGITLDANTLYELNGTVDITPNFINLNGAMLKGSFPEKDIIMSGVSGAVLRSTNQHVSLQGFSVVPKTGATSAYNFSDATGDKICILFPGLNVVDALGASQGVGMISGFRLVALLQNYWRCNSGLKLSGNIERFVCGYTYATGIASGSAIEFQGSLNASIIDISNNQFNTIGVPGIINSGGTITDGRLHSNIFSNSVMPIAGFTKKDANWWMSNNNAIPDSRILAQVHLATTINNSSVPTNTFQVVAGTYSPDINNERFTQNAGRLVLSANKTAVVSITASLSINSLANTSGEVLEFEIRKNGISLAESRQLAAIKGTSDFTNITLSDITSLDPGDYIEVWGRNTTSTAAWRVEKMIFSVR